MEEKDKQGPFFFLFYIFLCVRMWCLVLWQLSLHHEDRSKSNTEKLTQNPVIGELLRAPQSHSNSFFCETNKPLFQNLLGSDYSITWNQTYTLGYMFITATLSF